MLCDTVNVTWPKMVLLKRLDELLVFKSNQVTCLDIQKEHKIYYMTGIPKYLLCVF